MRDFDLEKFAKMYGLIEMTEAEAVKVLEEGNEELTEYGVIQDKFLAEKYMKARILIERKKRGLE